MEILSRASTSSSFLLLESHKLWFSRAKRYAWHINHRHTSMQQFLSTSCTVEKKIDTFPMLCMNNKWKHYKREIKVLKEIQKRKHAYLQENPAEAQWTLESLSLPGPWIHLLHWSYFFLTPYIYHLHCRYQEIMHNKSYEIEQLIWQ